MTQAPNWAKPVAAAAIKVHTARRKARKEEIAKPTDMAITCFERRQIKFELL
jgi:hypothetical protein